MAKATDQFTQLLKATEEVDIAVHLSRVYEFKKDAADAANLELLQIDPRLPHSWVSTRVPVARRDGVRVNLVRQDGKYSLDLPTGVIVVMGMSGSGKTRLTRDFMFANNARSRYVTYGEPVQQNFAELYPGADVAEFEPMLATTVATYLIDPSTDLVIVDSLRYLFYGEGKSTGKGGVNMELFTSLTFLDNVASALGKTVIVIINPLTDDPAVFKFYEEAAMGAVAGVITMIEPTKASITTRLGRRERRAVQIPNRASADAATDKAQLVIDSLVGDDHSSDVNRTLFGSGVRNR